MGKKKTKNSSAVIKLLLIFVIIIGSTLAFFSIKSNNLKMLTERIYTTKSDEKILTNGVILKDEVVINDSFSGFLSYTHKDGGKVKAGGIVANVYDSQAHAVNITEKSRYESEYKNLLNLNNSKDGLNISVSTVETQIASELYNYATAYAGGNYEDLWSYRENIQYYLNERKLIIGEVSDYNDRISELKDKIDSYPSDNREVKNYITSSKPGYFSSIVDGYESIYTIDNLEDLTLESYEELLKKKPEKVKNPVGKILCDAGFYIVSPVSNSILLNMAGQSVVSVNFLESGIFLENVYIQKIITNTSSENGLIVLKCDLLNEKTINLRNEKIEIILNTYAGFKIPKTAIRIINGYCDKYDANGNLVETTETKIKGVYVFFGNQLIYRYISDIFSAEDYVMASKNNNPYNDYYYIDEKGEKVYISSLKEFDIMVIKGADLYNGKPIS